MLWGCGGDEPAKRRDDRIFFPLQTGFYQIYDVDESIYSEINEDEFLTYELKTEVVDSFISLGGETTFVIHRSTRPDETYNWEFLDTWSAKVDDNKLILTEGNTAYIQLVFPLSPSSSWNANAFNTKGADEYAIDGFNTSYQLENNVTFDNAVIVEQADEYDLINRDQRTEVYAPHVGLIYKKSIVLNYCDEGACVGLGVIMDGREYYQELKAYGQD